MSSRTCTMGCTSSAPTTVPSNPNTTDKSIPLIEDLSDKHTKNIDEQISADANETQEINVLPTCDTETEPIQLVRNKNSFLEAARLEKDKDCQTNGHVIENIELHNPPESTQEDEKISTLEEVIEKVIEQNIHNDVICDDVPDHTDSDSDDNVVNTENQDGQVASIEVHEQSDENLEIAISPTQSESSRATRWEALADIAAELPPSLAVDPVTGQIYSLSK